MFTYIPWFIEGYFFNVVMDQNHLLFDIRILTLKKEIRIQNEKYGFPKLLLLKSMIWMPALY